MAFAPTMPAAHGHLQKYGASTVAPETNGKDASGAKSMAIVNGRHSSVPSKKLRQDDEEQGKLFVGGLSWDTTQDSLLRYFSRFGEVVDCVVMKNADTGRSRRFGFVTYSDPGNVDAVLASSPHSLDGRTIDPKACNPRSMQKPKRTNLLPKVFLGGLPSSITETDLRSFFSSYGEVCEVVIMYDQEKKKSRGFGFLSFADEPSCARAVADHYVTIQNKKVEIKRAEPRTNHGAGDGNNWVASNGTHPMNQSNPPSQSPSLVLPGSLPGAFWMPPPPSLATTPSGPATSMPPPTTPMQQPPPSVPYGVPPPAGTPLPINNPVPNGSNQQWTNNHHVAPPPSPWSNASAVSTFSTPPPVQIQNTLHYPGVAVSGTTVTPQPYWPAGFPQSGPGSLVATPPPAPQGQVASTVGDPYQAKWGFITAPSSTQSLPTTAVPAANHVQLYHQPYQQSQIPGHNTNLPTLIAVTSQPPTSKMPYNEFYQSTPATATILGQQQLNHHNSLDMAAAISNGGLGPQRVGNYAQPSSQVQGYHPYRRS